MNPIFWREARVRPRTRLAPLWVPAACIPAAGVLLAYLWGTTGPDAVTTAALKAFHTLAALQTLAWLVLGATSTAGAIASERERGLLESLQLSGMTPRSILAGKLAAALAFSVVVVAASLPVWALCVYLGGVNPELAAKVLCLHIATALIGASVGLAWSAWTRRAAAGLRVSLICLGIWGVGSALCEIVSRNNGPQWAGWAAWCVVILRLAGATNPLSAALSLSHDTPARSMLLMTRPSAALVWLDSVAATPPVVIAVIFQLAATPVLMWLAARGIAASFDAPPRPILGALRVAAARLVKTSTPPPPKPALVGPPFYDIPFVARLRFSNPVLTREIRGKFRQPRVPRWVILFQSALGLGVLSFYLLVAWWAQTRPSTRAQTWWVVAFTGLAVVMTAAPMMGAANFARERERGTWEGVHLTPLSARAISFGKIGSALLAIAAFSLPLLPLLSLCALRPGGVSALQGALTFAIAAATAYGFSSFGTLLSWKAERTAPIAGGMLLLVASQAVTPFLASRPGLQWLIAINPPSALAVTAGAARSFGLAPESPLALAAWPLACVVTLVGTGALCESAVRRALRSQGHP